MSKLKKIWNRFLNRIMPGRRARLLSKIMQLDQELGLYNEYETMNLTCKDCKTELDSCQCLEITLNLDKAQIVDGIEHRIKTEHQKHGQSLPHDWARIAASKIYATYLNR
jgi:hypothetical protein